VEETLVWLRGWLNVVYLEIYIHVRRGYMCVHVRRRIHVCTCEEEDTCVYMCGGGYMCVHVRRRIHVCTREEEDTCVYM